MMRAMEIVSGQLALALLPVPMPAPGEVLIRTAFIGLNRADILQVAGKYPAPEGASPLPGLEVSGTIEALGEGTLGWTVGEQACALLAGGGYAEYVVVPAGQVLPVPNSLTLKAAAAFPEAAATSIMALVQEGQLKKGERFFMHGGTSGLGLLMTQIARSLGAEVYASVGSDEKAAFLSELGITAINHRAAPFVEQLMALTGNEGVDLIVDTLGGPQLGSHLGLLRKGGRMVSLAMMEGPVVESTKIGRMLTHYLRWSGITLRSRTPEQKAEIIRQVHDLVLPQVATNAVRPVVDQVFPLAEAEKALARMEERLHLGKILLEVGTK